METVDRRARIALQDLGIPAHRVGYKMLCVAIPIYSKRDMMSMTKELYPQIAKHFNIADYRAVEKAIRNVISTAWEKRNHEDWQRYFGEINKTPTNMLFISTISERIK